VKLDELVAAGEAMLEALGREHYLTLAGLKSEPQFQRIYEQYGDLTTDEAVATVRATASPPLVEWIVGNRVGRRLASLDELQLRWEQQTSLTVNGETIDYLRAPIALANSPDRKYRMALDAACSAAKATGLNPILRDRLAAEHAEMRALGYDDYVTGIAVLSGIDLEALAAEAARFLGQSADMYFDSLSRLARQRAGVGLDRLVRADTAWTFRADRYDAAFPAARLVELAREQMGEMGLDALQAGRVRLDTEERPGKQSRAFCVPARVPEEVYLVIRPHGGHNDYRTFWHELGHAMHLSSPSRDAPFESRWLGDTSVTEAYAMLWDHLTLDHGWLRRYTDLRADEIRTLGFELAVQELHLVRRYAAKLQYELLLHRRGGEDLGQEYAEMLTAATGFRYSEEDHLADVDAAFYCARHLRAWQTEARITDTLTERFDASWFRDPEAGGFVQELMTRGQATPADQLAREVTGRELCFDPIRHRLAAMLG
jgi:oligoendopeptidase F